MLGKEITSRSRGANPGERLALSENSEDSEDSEYSEHSEIQSILIILSKQSVWASEGAVAHAAGGADGGEGSGCCGNHDAEEDLPEGVLFHVSFCYSQSVIELQVRRA